MTAGRSYARYLRSRSGPGIALSIVLIGIVIVGAVTFIIRFDPFWLAIAVLVLLAALVPAISRRNGDWVMAWWLLLPISSAFIVNIIGLATGTEPLSMSSPIGWAIAGVSLFTLCWAIMAMIDGRGTMSLRPQYLAISAFAFFEAVVIIQGWLSYLSDQGLGTHLVPSNFDFMAFFILCTTVAVVLALLVRHVGRPKRGTA